jgi:hypothetical protein
MFSSYGHIILVSNVVRKAMAAFPLESNRAKLCGGICGCRFNREDSDRVGKIGKV